MDITEAIAWLKSVRVAGEELSYSDTVIESHNVKFVLNPTQEHFLELKIGQPLRTQKGDPKNVLIKKEGKIVLVVITD